MYTYIYYVANACRFLQAARHKIEVARMSDVDICVFIVCNTSCNMIYLNDVTSSIHDHFIFVLNQAYYI